MVLLRATVGKQGCLCGTTCQMKRRPAIRVCRWARLLLPILSPLLPVTLLWRSQLYAEAHSEFMRLQRAVKRAEEADGRDLDRAEVAAFSRRYRAALSAMIGALGDADNDGVDDGGAYAGLRAELANMGTRETFGDTVSCRRRSALACWSRFPPHPTTPLTPPPLLNVVPASCCHPSQNWSGTRLRR